MGVEVNEGGAEGVTLGRYVGVSVSLKIPVSEMKKSAM